MNTVLEPETSAIRPSVVSRQEWLNARRDLLAKEKLLTRMRDELNRDRLKLPWVKLAKSYTFDSVNGPVTLADLFEDRSQLFIYHFMFGPGWKEGCVGCSFLCDHLESTLVHLNHHDVSVAVVSRAPLEELQAFKKRMGWKFNWVSSYHSDFNYDFNVSFPKEKPGNGKVSYNFSDTTIEELGIDELSGSSAFYRDENGDVFHTYSAYARGDESLLGAYMVLDMMPKGRNEKGPRHDLSDWVRHHDRYDAKGYVDPTGRFREGASSTCECTTA